MSQTVSLMISNSVKRLNYAVFTVLSCVSCRPPAWPSALSWRAPCSFQFLGFSQAFMTSLPDVTGHTHDTDAFEGVEGILFHGEAGFLARLMDSPL